MEEEGEQARAPLSGGALTPRSSAIGNPTSVPRVPEGMRPSGARRAERDPEALVRGQRVTTANDMSDAAPEADRIASAQRPVAAGTDAGEAEDRDADTSPSDTAPGDTASSNTASAGTASGDTVPDDGADGTAPTSETHPANDNTDPREGS